jgi:hypothetical protein
MRIRSRQACLSLCSSVRIVHKSRNKRKRQGLSVGSMVRQRCSRMQSRADNRVRGGATGVLIVTLPPPLSTYTGVKTPRIVHSFNQAGRASSHVAGGHMRSQSAQRFAADMLSVTPARQHHFMKYRADMTVKLMVKPSHRCAAP